MSARSASVLVASVALVVAALLAAAVAQPFGPVGEFMGPGMMSGSGMMPGPGMMYGRRGFGGFCNPAATGFAERRADRLAEIVQPTDAQRASFEEFKQASIKSAEVMRSGCLTEVPETIVARAEAMEKRMDTMLQAMHTMRPALGVFYASLSDEQKARLDQAYGGYGRGGFRHWRDRW